MQTCINFLKITKKSLIYRISWSIVKYIRSIFISNILKVHPLNKGIFLRFDILIRGDNYDTMSKM